MEKNSIINWLNNARAVSLVQSFIPCLLAFLFALKTPNSNWALGLVAIFGVLIAHLSANLLDDYFDFKSNSVKKRNELGQSGIRARLLKCEYFKENSPKKVLFVALFFALIAISLGAIILYFTDIKILYIALLGAFISFFYSAPPIKLSYRGLGEISIGIIFGPLLMSGVYYSMTNTLSTELLIFSIYFSFLIVNIIYTHSIMDFKADKAAEKNTLAVILDKKELKLFALLLFVLLPYLIIFLAQYFNIISKHALVCLLSLPLNLYLFYLMYDFEFNPEKKHKRYFFMGNMPNWEKIENEGLDWFMIRWYFARNILLANVLIIIFGYLIW